MFELEDPASGFHDGFINKYADLSGPIWDCYISDSLQDMIDIDIRSEVASVVGSNSNELSSLLDDLPSSLDHANDGFSSGLNVNANNGVIAGDSLSGIGSSWFTGASNGPSWSSSSDMFPDLSACVNPISVMPLMSTSNALLHKSPKINLNVNGLGLSLGASANSPTNSPNAIENKSHLAFSTTQLKIPANALRNEQLLSHIPKQIVAISSSVTSATTAPATMATNSALQRKGSIVNASVEAVKKDLNMELRKQAVNDDNTNKQTSTIGNNSNNNNGLLNSNTTTTNTIKLGPGIGGLTFANSITYNKLKQQSSVKSPQGSPVTANGTIVLKRERDASPLRSISTLNGGNNNSNNSINNSSAISKVLSRNSNTGFTPKSIASSAHSPHLQHSNNSNVGSPSTAGNSSTNGNSFQSLAAQTIANNVSAAKSPKHMPSMTVKSLHQKIKPVHVESEFPKPAYSYSCLIALSLKNSRSGSLPVSEIYSFMCEHFPYFKTAPSGWKNSVRHNLSLNKCFEKIEKPATNGSQRKGCLWAMNPERILKMDEEIQKWSRKDPSAIRNAMIYPEHLEALERGEMKHGSSGDSDAEVDSQSEIEENSDIEEQDIDETIMDNMFVEEEIEEDDEDEDSTIIMHNGVMSNDTIDALTDHTNDNDCSNDVEEADGNNDAVANTNGMLIQQQTRDYDIEVSLVKHTIKNGQRSRDVFEWEDTEHDELAQVQDLYDTIDLDEDDKDAVRMSITTASDIIELSPADMNSPQQHQHQRTQQIISNHNSNSSDGSNSGYQSPKRARLNVNYSFGPAGELAVKLNQQQQQQQQQQQRQQKLQKTQFFKQIKLQNGQQTLAQLQNQSPQQHVLVQTINNGNKTFQSVPASALTAISAAKLQQLAVLQSQSRRKMQLVNRIV